MAKSVQWELGLKDKLSAAAGAMGAKADVLASKLGGVTAAADKANAALGRARGANGRFLPSGEKGVAPQFRVGADGRMRDGRGRFVGDGKGGGAADAGLDRTEREARAAARAMEAYRAAVEKASAAVSKLNTRSAMGTKTGANGTGLFGASSGNVAGPKLSSFARLQQWAGNTFGSAGAEAVAKLGQAANQASGMLGKMGGALSAMAGPAMAVVAAMGLIVGAALAIGAALVGLGVKVGEYIGRLQAMKQAHMFAFTSLLKSAPAAERAWDDVRAASQRYGMDLGQTGAAFNDLLAKGFSLQQVKDLVGYMADLKTLNPSANVEALSRAIGQIKSKGRLQQEELTGQMAEAGLNVDLVYEALQKKLGKDRAGILKMITAGQIDANTGIQAIQDAIASQTGGKGPGGLAAEAVSKSFLGQMMRAKSMMDGFLSDLNIDFTPLTRLLDRIEKVFKGGSGAKLGAAIEGAFTRVGKALDKFTPEQIETGFAILEKTAYAVGFAIEFVVGSVRVLLDIVQGIADAAKSVNAEFDKMTKSMGIDGGPLGFEGHRVNGLGYPGVAAPVATTTQASEGSLLDSIIRSFAGGNMAAAGGGKAEAMINRTYNINIVANGIDQPSLAKMIAAEVQNAASQDADAP